jgi:pimeloyl-ACP methyl ester carboxylesterase
MTAATAASSRMRWGRLAGRQHGDADATGRSFVFLHGLTFDHRMWEPVLQALPESYRAIAFDLPGHGASPRVPQRGLEPVVEAIHEAVAAAELDAPIVVGHSIGGPLAMIYAATYEAAAVVSVDAPVRAEPFAELLGSLAPQLRGDGFDEVWSRFRASMHAEQLARASRLLLRAGDVASQEVVLAYQADLLERPLEEFVRWRDEGLERLRAKRTPYLALHANPVDASEQAWLFERLPHAELVVWAVGHHFPHLAQPTRFAGLLTGLAAGLPPDAAARVQA